MGAAEALIILAIGFVFCGGVAAFAGFIIYTLTKANRAITAGAQAIRSGQVPQLMPWSEGSVTSLSADWVGASTWSRGIGGKRDQASGLAQSVSQPGTVFAFQTNALNGWRDGRVELLGPGRLVLDVRQGVAQATKDGAPLGAINLDTGALTGADGRALGSLARDAALAGVEAGAPGPHAALMLDGRPVAVLAGDTTGHAQRPALLRPMVARYEPRGPDDEAWTLVACLLLLGWYGVSVEHSRIRTR